MSLRKKLRGFVAITFIAAVAFTASTPTAFAFGALGGASSNGKYLVDL